MTDNSNAVEPEDTDVAADVSEDNLDEENLDGGEVDDETDSEDLDEDNSDDGVTFAGMHFKSTADAERTFKEMQSRVTKVEQKFSDMEKQALRAEERKKLTAMTDEEKLNYLADKILENQYQAEVDEAEPETGFDTASDSAQISKFVNSKPEIAQYGLEDLFESIAQSDKFREYTLESIYEVQFKPMLEKLAGTKVTTKKRKLSKSKSKAPATGKKVRDMSNADYLANREQILRDMGMKI